MGKKSWVEDIVDYCDELGIETDSCDDYIDITGEVSLDDISKIYEFFCEQYHLKIEFATGLQNSFRISLLKHCE